MRIVFAGTPEFAVPALRALAEAGYPIAAVYTQPDRPAGRGRKLTPSPVKQTALALGLALEQPVSLREAQAAEVLARYAPDVMVVVAYGLLLPPSVLAVPRLGCLNIHASLLPRWRGAAPIQRALLAGDAVSGVSIMQMEPTLDTGPVYLQRRVEIGRENTAGALHERLAALGAEAILEVLRSFEHDPLPARPQDHAAACYASKIDKSEAHIDWTRSAEHIERQVKAFNPWPVAECRWSGQQLRIWSARAVMSAPSAAPGTALPAAQGILVACGQGALSLERVQLPGGRPVNAVAFLSSHVLSGDGPEFS